MAVLVTGVSLFALFTDQRLNNVSYLGGKRFVSSFQLLYGTHLRHSHILSSPEPKALSVFYFNPANASKCITTGKVLQRERNNMVVTIAIMGLDGIVAPSFVAASQRAAD